MITRHRVALAVFVSLFLSACASIHKGDFFGDPGLPDRPNFVHVKFVSASASNSYYLGIGAKEDDLLRQIHESLVERAELRGTSRKLVNITMDKSFVFFFITYTKTIHVSAEVIEYLPEPVRDSTSRSG